VHIEGSHSIAASREQVWEALNDPEVLARCLPGVTTLEPSGEDRYTAQLKLGVGPIRGDFKGRVEVRDKEPPAALTLYVEARGPMGTVRATGGVQLEDEAEATAVSYVGDAQLIGPMAGLGNRVMQSVAKTLAQQFFKALEREVRRA
jgi:carbon monoxide dehydrogenase subunit G